MTIKWIGVLSTTEPFNRLGLIKVRQSNVNSETFEFQIVENNQPKSLEGLKVYFNTMFGVNAVQQEAVIIDAKKGVIQYTMNDHDMQKPVNIQLAYFEFRSNDEYVGSTQSFTYVVQQSIYTEYTDSGTYIIRLEELFKLYEDFYKNESQKWEDFVEANRELLENIDPGGKILLELIESRKKKNGETYTNLKERLWDIDEQIEENKETLSNQIKSPQTLVTFISDDGLKQEMELASIFRAKQVPYTLAIPPNLPGNMGIDYLEELKNFQNVDGFEIVSHTYDHLNLELLKTEEEIEFQLSESQKWLKENGFKGYDIIVYPQGGNDERVRKLTRKYYKLGIGTLVNNGINQYPLVKYDIGRVGLGSYFNTEIASNRTTEFPPDGSSLEYYKARVDYAIANKQWLVFMMHPWHSAHTNTQKEYISQLVDYVKSKQIPIVKVKEAMNLVGNVIDVGDYSNDNAQNDYLSVGVNGKVKAKIVDDLTTTVSSSTNLINNYNFESNRLMHYHLSNGTNISYTLSNVCRDGKYSLKIKRLSNTSGHVITSIQKPEAFKGKEVESGIWARCPRENKGEFRLFIQDGVNFGYSETIPKDNQWHFVKAKMTMGVSSNILQLNIGRAYSGDLVSSGDELYVDSVFAVENRIPFTVLTGPVLLSSDIDAKTEMVPGSFSYNENFLYFTSLLGVNSRFQLSNQKELFALNSFSTKNKITDFRPNTVTCVPVSSSFASVNSFPGKEAGYFYTYNYGLDSSFKYQEYETLTGVTYRRSLDSNGNFKEWQTTAYRVGVSSERPTNPIKGEDFFDTSSNKPIWWNGMFWQDASGAPN